MTAAPGTIRLAFAGDREVAVRALRHLRTLPDVELVLLAVSAPGRASHAEELRVVAGPDVPVLIGDALRTSAGQDALVAARPDVLLSVHFPYLVPEAALAVPSIGPYNLHPGHLPHGRGWHTVTWALLEGGPVGCTLHRMTPELDRGPIVAQHELTPGEIETAHELYGRMVDAEVALLAASWPDVRRWPSLERAQPEGGPATRTASALERLPERDLRSRDTWPTEDLIRVLRALTTSRPAEAVRISGADGDYAVRLERLPDA